MKSVLINYDETILKLLNNQRLIVYDNLIDMLKVHYSEAIKNNEVIAMVVTLPFSSVSQINFLESWEGIPLIINAYNIGDYDLFLMKVDSIKHLNVRIYLNSQSETVYTDLKVMSSLGVDCGLLIDSNSILCDDKLLDLASYYYMSPASHASIEPFEFILRHLSDEKNESFDTIYFSNPLLYTRISSVEEAVEFNNSVDDFFNIRMANYYSHFMDLDQCSKCSAFKICSHNLQDKLQSCESTLSEIYEYAECRNELINKATDSKTICQL